MSVWAKLEEMVAEHVGLWKYGGVRGLSFPLEDGVYFRLFICAPETTGHWNSPTSASALDDLVEMVACARLRLEFSVFMQIVDSHSTGIRSQRGTEWVALSLAGKCAVMQIRKTAFSRCVYCE